MKVAAYAILCSALLAMPAFAWDEPSADDAPVQQANEPTPAAESTSSEPPADATGEAAMDDLFYDCSGSTCHSCNSGCFGCECDCNAGKFIHALFCGPDNMYQHMPYLAAPKTYYYFRPYTYMQVQTQQAQAQLWGADPGMPYSNAVFQEVYKKIASSEAEEAVLPPPAAE